MYRHENGRGIFSLKDRVSLSSSDKNAVSGYRLGEEASDVGISPDYNRSGIKASVDVQSDQSDRSDNKKSLVLALISVVKSLLK